MNSLLRILLAEDHPHVRLQLRLLLEKEPDFEVIAEAADGLEAVGCASRLQPDMLITDLGMPGLHGLGAAQRVLEANPATFIIIVSVNLDEPYVARALQLGVHGYVYKSACHDCLVAAVRTVRAGGRYLSPPIDRTLLDAYPAMNPLERGLLRRTADGISDDEIGSQLGMPKDGVSELRAQLMHRLGLSDLDDLAAYVRFSGWSPR